MNEIDLYKISSVPLSLEENELGIFRIEPTMGGSLPASEFFNFALSHHNETRELLTPSEVGCTLSHIEIYNKIIARGRGALIFEQDILPAREQISGAKEVIYETEFDYINFGIHPSIISGAGPWVREIKPTKRYPIYHAFHLKFFYGAFAYYISPHTANELIMFHKSGIKRADAWPEFFDQTIVTPYLCPIFHHPEERGKMDVERRSAEKVRKITAARRLVARKIEISRRMLWLRPKGFNRLKLPGNR